MTGHAFYHSMLFMILNERGGDDLFWRGAVTCHALEEGVVC